MWIEVPLPNHTPLPTLPDYYKGAPACFLLIVNWPFKKVKYLFPASWDSPFNVTVILYDTWVN
jgi:hypothetical protein